MSNWTVIFAVLLIMFVVLFVSTFPNPTIGRWKQTKTATFRTGFLRESTLLRTVVLCNPLTQQKISEMEVAT